MSNHVDAAGTMRIKGSHRGMDVVHDDDPAKRLHVMTDRKRQLISGWKLNGKQAGNVLERGSL